jgi:predicted nucleic acid-binding protein
VLIVSDTNILSSLAAGESLHLLFRLFPDKTIHIPPAVQHELSTGLARGRLHLEAVLQAIGNGQLQILHLANKEQTLAKGLPAKLNAGEREAIALSKNRKGRLLSNDQRAVRYCQQNNISVIDLPLMLRLLWTQKIVSQDQIKEILEKMQSIENLQLSQKALTFIFAQN